MRAGADRWPCSFLGEVGAGTTGAKPGPGFVRVVGIAPTSFHTTSIGLETRPAHRREYRLPYVMATDSGGRIRCSGPMANRSAE